MKLDEHSNAGDEEVRFAESSAATKLPGKPLVQPPCTLASMHPRS